MKPKTVRIRGKQFVLVEKGEFDRIRALADRVERLAPAIPAQDRRGLRPALQTFRAIMARDLIRDRIAAKLTQRELARRAGIRPETLCRIEAARHTGTEETMRKLEKALGKGYPTGTARGHLVAERPADYRVAAPKPVARRGKGRTLVGRKPRQLPNG